MTRNDIFLVGCRATLQRQCEPKYHQQRHLCIKLSSNKIMQCLAFSAKSLSCYTVSSNVTGHSVLSSRQPTTINTILVNIWLFHKLV